MNGTEIWKSIDSPDIFEEPIYSFKKVATNANDSSNSTTIVSVERIKQVFLNKFSKEKVMHTLTNGATPEERDQVSLSVRFEKSPYWFGGQGAISVNLEQFLEPDFEKLWKEINPNRPKNDTFTLNKSDYEDFLNYMKYKKEHEQDNHIQ
jgi:hypothetical protein